MDMSTCIRFGGGVRDSFSKDNEDCKGLDENIGLSHI